MNYVPTKEENDFVQEMSEEFPGWTFKVMETFEGKELRCRAAEPKPHGMILRLGLTKTTDFNRIRKAVVTALKPYRSKLGRTLR